MFLRTQCEQNSSHPVLKEVSPQGRSLSFPEVFPPPNPPYPTPPLLLGRSLSFPFFLSGQDLNSRASWELSFLDG